MDGGLSRLPSWAIDRLPASLQERAERNRVMERVSRSRAQKEQVETLIDALEHYGYDKLQRWADAQQEDVDKFEKKVDKLYESGPPRNGKQERARNEMRNALYKAQSDLSLLKDVVYELKPFEEKEWKSLLWEMYSNYKEPEHEGLRTLISGFDKPFLRKLRRHLRLQEHPRLSKTTTKEMLLKAAYPLIESQINNLQDVDPVFAYFAETKIANAFRDKFGLTNVDTVEMLNKLHFSFLKEVGSKTTFARIKVRMDDGTLKDVGKIEVEFYDQRLGGPSMRPENVTINMRGMDMRLGEDEVRYIKNEFDLNFDNLRAGIPDFFDRQAKHDAEMKRMYGAPAQKRSA